MESFMALSWGSPIGIGIFSQGLVSFFGDSRKQAGPGKNKLPSGNEVT